MTGLYDVPGLPPNLLRPLLVEMREFKEALRQRAPFADMAVAVRQAARQATNMPPAVPPWGTFGEDD
jgi:hypothetical protein